MIKILVVRRDNIGDLICTLPLVAALRKLNPGARLDILVNTYNMDVVKHISDLDRVYAYTKDKHRNSKQGWFLTYLQRICLIVQLLLTRYDYVILANVGFSKRSLRWAALIRPKHVIGFVEKNQNLPKYLDMPVLLDRSRVYHEVEYLMLLSRHFGDIKAEALPHLIADNANVERARSIISCSSGKVILGINISARLPSQQWALNNWISLVTESSKIYRCVIFWSPGSETNKLHPGDDAKSKQILESTKGCDVIAFQTSSLADLIAGLSLVDLVVSADGGAMHIAAACQKPVVALFGDSDARQWYPWGVQHLILQTPGRHVNEITVDSVIDACLSLAKNCETTS